MNDARSIDTLTQIPYNTQRINEEDSWKEVVKRETGKAPNR